MRATMRKTIGAIALFVTALTAQSVFAYYNPSTGRFLSRDPIGEPGFQVLQMAQGASQVGPVPMAQQSSRWINRDSVQEISAKLLKQSGEGSPVMFMDWQSVLRDTANAYRFVGNTPVNRWDVLGLFGDGDVKFKGHKDFSNLAGCPFNYTLEDQGSTSPWPGIGDPERHFRPLGRSESDVQAAIKSCTRDAFQRAMHRGQDYFSHYAKGYVWDPGNVFQKCAGYGHACDGTKPDEDPAAWSGADGWTKRWLKKWSDACCGCGH